MGSNKLRDLRELDLFVQHFQQTLEPKTTPQTLCCAPKTIPEPF